MIRFASLCVLLCLIVAPAIAQVGIVQPAYVFWQAESGNTGDLIFIDGVTGVERRFPVNGERFTIYQDGVMFFDTALRQVMFVRRDGVIDPHPFVRLPAGANRVDWTLSAGGDLIAWTITAEDSAGRLTTETRIADTRLGDERVIFTQTDADGSRLRALPVGFSADGTQLYLDNHPHGISDFIPFDQYVALFALDLATGEDELLPGEFGSQCICGAAVDAGVFLRLRLRDDSPDGLFDLHIYDLISGGEAILPPLNISGHDTAGDLLISPDGGLAVYALAQVQGFNTPGQSVRTAFVLVDIFAGTQRTLTAQPVTQYLRPVAWTEDNSAIILTSPAQRGTWKINISDGRLERIASAAYVGVIR